jgi:hypothetical protein
MEVKALACELPKDLGLPFSRLTRALIAEQAVARGIVATLSGATVWRWLHADAIRPWCCRSWIWPRDPCFEARAGVVLDLCQRVWNGTALLPDEYVVCPDEKTGIQARRRPAPTSPAGPGRAGRLEFGYERRGALAYMAAWDVHRAKIFGRCEQTTGIGVYHRLVDHVMSQEPYRSARRVFWVADNGSSHRGQASQQRLADWHPNAVQVHTPVHASWLNQVEIFFSVVQRAVLTPNDFHSLAEVEERLLAFQTRYEQTAKPFHWTFSRQDLKQLLAKVTPCGKPASAAA